MNHHDTGYNIFCLNSHADCGKTYTQTAIIHELNSLNLRCILTAFSDIALILLLGRRTLHFSSYRRYINSSSLIIIDEVIMYPSVEYHR